MIVAIATIAIRLQVLNVVRRMIVGMLLIVEADLTGANPRLNSKVKILVVDRIAVMRLIVEEGPGADAAMTAAVPKKAR